MLRENEWITINRVLLELYKINNMDELIERLLKMIRMLIPFSKGYFLTFDKNGIVDKQKSKFIEMEDELEKKYMDYYYGIDYLKYVYDFARESITYRDTDILEDNIRKKTEFYDKFLRPHNIPFGAGIIIMKNEKIKGIINLFRSRELGDFSDKDMYILEILKDHLYNIQNNIDSSFLENNEDKKVSQAIVIQNDLSDREVEVIKLINKGKSNAEIAQILLISLSTVKKHVYNIYTKIGVNSRIQLMAYINNNA